MNAFDVFRLAISGTIKTYPVAEKYNKTPAQVALHWNLRHEVVMIPKSINSNRIVENAHCLKINCRV
ncbi:hypothetical protein PbJCM13498_01830 [Prolixibacter bellariivorans]|jgi:diketogulonate reductase-like aldo/keto reductase|uniref:NADP-dependent oxidoreductase domain-containing protein n=1 Tax=Prolixibacter bellariivorans TaxID=314319 RepID=A0A5M4ATR3_9BACT|nr:hypothetical protein PbJCM13498_01830 [Prolixibacter bellariivorans]